MPEINDNGTENNSDKPKKITPTSVRLEDENDTFVNNWAKGDPVLDKSKVINFIIKDYVRRNLEQTSEEGPNFKSLREYFDKIFTLFKAVTDTSQEKVNNAVTEQIKLSEANADLIIKNRDCKKENGEKDKKIEELEKDLKKYAGFEDIVNASIKSKDEEIEKLREENQSIQDLKKEIDDLKANATLRTAEHFEQLDKFRIELENTRKSYRDENEQLRENHRKEIENIRNEHSRETSRIREDNQTIVADLESRHKREIEDLRARLAEAEEKLADAEKNNDTEEKA